jgi:hypothetical protein
MRTLVAVAGVAVVTALAGCTTSVKIDGVPEMCTRASSFTVVHAPSHLVVEPPCVIAPPGTTATPSRVTLMFKPPTIGKARTKPKGNESWLMGDNSQDPQVITITIDPNATTGGPGHPFILEVEGTGTLDPRIVVQ